MNKDAKPSHWNQPLTKGDFYVYQLERQVDIYSAIGWIVFVLAIVTASKAMYDFFVGAEYYGLDKALYSALGFLVGRGALKKYGELRDEQRRIQQEAARSEE